MDKENQVDQVDRKPVLETFGSVLKELNKLLNLDLEVLKTQFQVQKISEVAGDSLKKALIISDLYIAEAISNFYYEENFAENILFVFEDKEPNLKHHLLQSILLILGTKSTDFGSAIPRGNPVLGSKFSQEELNKLFIFFP
jgi:hypothetical protein